jgi:hypothetical protein
MIEKSCFGCFVQLEMCVCVRIVDRRSNVFMSIDELGTFRFQPQTVEILMSLLPNIRQWDILIAQKKVSCIVDF